MNSSLIPQNTVFMDLEIKESVASSEGGWAAAREGRLGVSCTCIYDAGEDCYSIYDDHSLDACVLSLESAGCVVTFNGREFDIPCLSGYTGKQLQLQGHYDILQEVWHALGGRKKGHGLNALCERTLGKGKIGEGEFAPDLWAQGRMAELHTYCMRDVYLTKELFNHILTKGYVIDVHGEKLQLRPYEESLISE